MTMFFPILIVLFIISLLLFGPNGAFKSLPFLVVISAISSFFLWFVVAFFPVILVIVIINYIRNQGKPKSSGGRTRTYYYSSGNAKDFEDFFRKAGGNQNYGNFNYGGGQGNPYEAFEDKSKYYNVLGVETDSSQDDIKKAYRGLARKHHPDRYATADDDVKAYHEKKFKEINEAYDKLAKK